MAETRAVRAPPFDGLPTWRGQFRSVAGAWFTIRNESGSPIAYATPQAARKAAALVGAAWRLNERITGEMGCSR